jgi:hypothetical protein
MTEEIHEWSKFITEKHTESDKHGFPISEKFATYELVKLVKRDKLQTPYNRWTTLYKKEDAIQKAIEIIKNLENPYPKDIFVWDNKEKLDFNRGRFNKFNFELVEKIKTILISHLEDEVEA